MTRLRPRQIAIAAAAPLLLAMTEAPFGTTVDPVPPPVLDTIRGGFLLPNGIDLAMTVQTETAVDGHVVLRSVFSADQGPATLTVFAPAAGKTGPALANTATAAEGAVGGTGQGVSVSLDRTSGIVSIQPTGSGVAPGTMVTVAGTGQAAGSEADDGLVPVALNGPSQAAAGTVSIHTAPTGPTVEYSAPDLVVDHLFGRAFGSVVANTANDRSIDTVTSVSLDLHNATAALVGSSLVQAQTLALDAARGMSR